LQIDDAVRRVFCAKHALDHGHQRGELVLSGGRVPASQVQYARSCRVLATICSRRTRKDIPLDRLRDRVRFETAYTCGVQAAEACGLYVEDLDLRPDDEHVRIHEKAAPSGQSCWMTAATSRCSSYTWPARDTPAGRCPIDAAHRR
jgi:integrase